MVFGAILASRTGVLWSSINTIPQAQAISTNLVVGKLGLNELLVYIDGVLSNLYMGSEYEKFEEALNQIGMVLGFVFAYSLKDHLNRMVF